jgi:hypothetical protein
MNEVEGLNLRLKLMNKNGYFTQLPNRVCDTLIMSRLPIEAKWVVLIVLRNSIWYHRKTCLLTWATVSDFIPIHKSRITLLINGLLKLNILYGGEVKKYSNGRISAWELSVNLEVTTWDVSIPASNRVRYYKMLDDNQKWKNLPEQFESTESNPHSGVELPHNVGRL